MPDSFLSSQMIDKWNNLKHEEIKQILRIIYLETVKLENNHINIQIN